MTDLDSILKSRDSTLPTNVLTVFLVAMYGCESEHSRHSEMTGPRSGKDHPLG